MRLDHEQPLAALREVGVDVHTSLDGATLLIPRLGWTASLGAAGTFLSAGVLLGSLFTAILGVLSQTGAMLWVALGLAVFGVLLPVVALAGLRLLRPHPPLRITEGGLSFRHHRISFDRLRGVTVEQRLAACVLVAHTDQGAVPLLTHIAPDVLEAVARLLRDCRDTRREHPHAEAVAPDALRALLASARQG